MADKPIHCALLVPGPFVSRIAGAAALAVERVNADKSLLPGRRLEYSWADSGCSAQQGLAAMGKLLGGVSRVDAVIGPGCSSACEVTSYLAAGQNISQVSYACTAVSLSDTDLHPLVRLDLVSREFFDCPICDYLMTLQFSRTVAPDTSKGPALIAFMQHNKWRKIAIISSTVKGWIEASSGLSNQLEAKGMEVLKPAAFEPKNFKDTTLSEIRRSGLRVVLLVVSETDAQNISTLACQELMTSAGWAWLLTEERAPVNGMAGWLFFRPFLVSEMQAFAKQVSIYSKLHFEVASTADSVNLMFSAALYDAIMLYAHGATTVMSKGGDLRDGKAVTAAVRSASFTGVGGTLVVLDRKGDRIESYEMINYLLKEGDVMSSVAVGIFNSTQRQYKAYERAVVWPGGGDAPNDYIPYIPGAVFCICPKMGVHICLGV